MFRSFEGLKQALWGGAPPTLVEVGAGLLELSTEAHRASEAGAWLQENHKDRFMVWNLLPELDAAAFDDHVMSVAQLVDRSPLLEETLRICHAIRAWIDCDEGNIAIIVYASSDAPMAVASTYVCCAHLLYSRAQASAHQAWRHVWQQRAVATQGVSDFLLDEEEAAAKGRVDLPNSHMTYLRYIQALSQHGVVGEEPIFIQRIVLHSIPVVASSSSKVKGCCPVFTITKASNGRQVFSSDWRTGPDASPKTCAAEELSAIFPVDTALMGDVIVSLHHHDVEGSCLLATFSLHTALIYLHCLHAEPSASLQQGLMRLDRTALGLSLSDTRFDQHFAIDLLISPHPAPPRVCMYVCICICVCVYVVVVVVVVVVVFVFVYVYVCKGICICICI